MNQKTDWNLHLLYLNEADIQKEREENIKKTDQFATKWKNNIEYLKDEKLLAEALYDYEQWSRDCGGNYKEVYYYHCKYSQDQNDPQIKASLNKAEEVFRDQINKVEFFYLSLGTITKEDQEKFLHSDLLRQYRYFLQRIFDKAKYFLSEKEEMILNLKSATAYDNWIMMTEGFLSKEEKEVIQEDGNKKKCSFEEIMTLISSQDKSVRDDSARALNEILDKYSDVAEMEINSILQDKKINDSLRGFDRPDKSRHVGDSIETEVVDSLINSVKEKFSTAHKFYNLKARLMGFEKLAYHERNVEIGGLNQTYSYDQALLMVKDALGGLDSEFSSIIHNFQNQGQIDIFPKKGKHGGAYCSHGLICHPTYILLNYTNKLNDVLTLAHELGHGINNELMRKSQNSLYFGSTLAIAEVASTFMEGFVLDKVLEQADDELKLSILMHRIGSDISTIYRQVACYLFEKELHSEFRNKGYLSKKEIGDIFQKNMKAYMGDFVDQSAGSENWWVYWSHIRSYFYVYSYASGLLIARSLQYSVKNDPSYIKKVKQVLSAGTSASPKDIFTSIGVDIADKHFWTKGLEEVDNLLKEAEDLAIKLEKI